MAIKITLDDAKVAAELRDLANKSEQAMTRTMSDIRKRGPSWISKGIREEYNLTAAKVKDRSKVRVSGGGLGDLTFTYTGNLLTPASFNMSPDKPKPGAYTIKATIKRGKRATIGRVKKITKRQRKNIGRNFTRQGARTSPSSPPRLMGTGAKRAGGTSHIPFQRTKYGGSTSGGPMDHVIKTVSVPQMIKDGKGNLKPSVRKELNENIEKRFDHHIGQIMK